MIRSFKRELSGKGSREKEKEGGGIKKGQDKESVVGGRGRKGMEGSKEERREEEKENRREKKSDSKGKEERREEEKENKGEDRRE